MITDPTERNSKKDNETVEELQRAVSKAQDIDWMLPLCAVVACVAFAVGWIVGRM